MDITITTTPDEDAAIVALTGEAPDAFVTSHVRHQINFVLAQVRPLTVAEKYSAAAPDERAAVDAILTKVAAVPVKLPPTR